MGRRGVVGWALCAVAALRCGIGVVGGALRRVDLTSARGIAEAIKYGTQWLTGNEN